MWNALKCLFSGRNIIIPIQYFLRIINTLRIALTQQLGISIFYFNYFYEKVF